MFRKNGEADSVAVNELISRKTMANGEKTLLVEIHLTKGADLPLHNHPHEQIGYLVSGRVVFSVGGEETVVEPGDGWCFKGNIEHGAKALEDSLAIEVFSPVREEYLS